MSESNVNQAHPRATGFTLVELLVVIAIIALLISILLPATRKSRVIAVRAVCASQMREIGNAVVMRTVEYNGVLPGPSWAGQSTAYAVGSQKCHGTNNLAEYVAIYLGNPAPTRKRQDAVIFICPAYKQKFKHPIPIHRYRCYMTTGNKPKSQGGERYFGYPAFNGRPCILPSKVTEVQRPAEVQAMQDIDQKRTGTTWQSGGIIPTTVHPSHGYEGRLAARNYLFFDGHVALELTKK